MPVEYLIDISSYNAVNDWNAVRANGIVGASIKVSQQVNYLNPLCGQQAAGARGAGIAPGGYHFGDPRVSPTAQAQFFVDNARQHGFFNDEALAPMYDAENWEGGGLVWPSPQVLNDHIREHIRVVRAETGVQRHLVYGSLSWWQSRWIDPDAWADENVLLWIAVYNGRPGDLQGWSHPNDALHQYTSAGIVPGIPGQVDKNVTLRDRGIGDLVNGIEDDMQLTDRMKNAWGGTPTMEEVFRYIDLRATEAAEGTAAANSKLDALLGRNPGTLNDNSLAKQLLEHGLQGQLGTLPDDQFELLAKAVADDKERRVRLKSS